MIKESYAVVMSPNANPLKSLPKIKGVNKILYPGESNSSFKKRNSK